MPVTDIKLVEAYRARNPAQAHAIKFALEDAGIRVVVENESLQDAIGEFPGGWTSAPRLLVEESQLAAAREMIGRTDRGMNSAPELTLSEAAFLPMACLGFGLGELPDSSEAESNRCLACDTIMSESESTCPNCGWTYESNSAGESKA